MAHGYTAPRHRLDMAYGKPMQHAFWKIWSGVGITGGRYLEVIVHQLKEPRVPKLLEF